MRSQRGRLWTVALRKRLQRAYRNSELRKLRLWFEGKTLHWSLYLALASLLISGLLGAHHYRSSFFYIVNVEGEEIGMVHDESVVEQFLDDLMSKCSSFYGMPVEFEQEVTLNREYRSSGEENPGAVQEALRRQISLVTDAVMLTVDQVPVVPLRSEKEVDEVVDLLSNRFASQVDNKNLLKTCLVEEVGAAPCCVSPERVCAPGEVADLLCGDGEIEEGRALLASRAGEKLQLEEALPQVHVQTVEEIRVTETIPFKTSYRYSSKMWYAQSRVITQGEAGKKEVSYHVTRENGREIARKKVDERILLEPVTRVVEKGTARAPSLGSGRFLWPVEGGGKISSGYRTAGRPGHVGIDIWHSNGTNTRILAADSGAVVETGWDPARGNYIVLYHGSYYTVYAHNRVNRVSAGDTVSRGQCIALMGNTGRTYGRTGVHLHFEVRLGHLKKWSANPTVNPLNFFSP